MAIDRVARQNEVIADMDDRPGDGKVNPLLDMTVEQVKIEVPA